VGVAKPNILERLIMAVAPRWGLSRARARLMARHYEAASAGRRTSGWSRRLTDANSAASGPALAYLRAQARDLVRNNPWARRGLRRLVTNTVGWGIRPKATGRGAPGVMELWKRWGETTECDAAGRLTFYGLQRLVMRTVVESGEVLIRRRLRRPDDGLAIPMQLEVLEPDYIDTSKDGFLGIESGTVIQGVEFDAIGRRVAYWLFDQHPGSSGPSLSATSRRVSASGILHVYDQDRPGQVRGPSWLAPVDVRLHDFDEFEDATLMKAKIAACLAAFVTDIDGSGVALGEAGTDPATDKAIDTLEPGMILNLPVGKQVTIANPPQATDHQSYSQTALRGVAAGFGVTYEDLTGDYSHVNFSSARMARIAHMGDLHDWRWNMLIPQFCAPAWTWMLEVLDLVGAAVDVTAQATWTPPPAPMIDPNTEGQALMRMLRTGAMTFDQMVAEQGYDPDEFFAEYAGGLDRLDKLKIILDSDPRKTTGAGQAQALPAKPGSANGAAKPNGIAKPNGAEAQAEEN
jgi:lambda family phage portal protein